MRYVKKYSPNYSVASEPIFTGNAYPGHNHTDFIGDITTTDDLDIRRSKNQCWPNPLNTILVNLVNLAIESEFEVADQSTLDSSSLNKSISDYFEKSLSSGNVSELSGKLNFNFLSLLTIESY